MDKLPPQGPIQAYERASQPEGLASSNVQKFMNKIRSVRDRITAHFRPAPTENELTNLTDEALVYDAEMSIDISAENGGTESVEAATDAVGTVLVEGAMEARGQQQTGDSQNPILTLIEDGYEEAVNDGLDVFGNDTLPDGENLKEVVIDITGQESHKSLEEIALPRSINERINLAYETSSFKQSPEVKEAIRGYYEDHYKLGALVECVIDGSGDGIDRASIDDQFENYYLREVAKNLLSQSNRLDALMAAEAVLGEVLFNEIAVAQETLSEAEDAYIIALAEKFHQKAVSEGFAYRRPIQGAAGGTRYDWNRDLPVPHKAAHMIKFDQNQIDARRSTANLDFWEDTRHAGQLEFHNSGQFDKISAPGFVLRSRTQQQELTGTFHAQMPTHQRPDGNMHTNLPHFSETYDPRNYKAQVDGKDVVKVDGRSFPATAAIPLAVIISTAPYARNARYGIVELKDIGQLDQVPVKDGTGDIGSQGADMHGLHGEDRVFMADNRSEHARKAVNYDLNFGDTGYVVMTEVEKNNTTDGTSQAFGHGQGYAREVVVPGIDFLAFQEQHRDLPADEQSRLYAQQLNEVNSKQAAAIRELQQQSRESPEYKDKLVVPLRRGVIEFVPEAQESIGRSAHYNRFQKYASLSPAA